MERTNGPQVESHLSIHRPEIANNSRSVRSQWGLCRGRGKAIGISEDSPTKQASTGSRDPQKEQGQRLRCNAYRRRQCRRLRIGSTSCFKGMPCPRGVENPSPRVFLKPDAKLEDGLRRFRAIALVSVFSTWYTTVLVVLSHEEKEPDEWRRLHVGAEREVNCELRQAFVTDTFQQHWEWQEDRRTTRPLWQSWT